MEVFSHTTMLSFAQAYRLGNTSQHLQKAAASSSLASSRELLMIRDTTTIRARLGELALKVGSSESGLSWHTGYDTLVVGRTKSVEEYLRSETFSVPSGALLKYRITNQRRGSHSYPPGMQLFLEVVDSTTGQAIGVPGQLALNGLGQGRQDSRASYPLAQFAGKSVFVRIRPSTSDTTVRLSAVDYYHDPATTLPKDGDNATSWLPTPSEMKLMANRPNPFSTFTEITVTLERDEEIDLSVYDLLGRRVETLFTGVMNAGSRNFIFHAAELPSGVFIARLASSGTVRTQTMTHIQGANR